MFPFTLRALETRNYTSSPQDFRASWMKVKPKDLGWYAYDVEILSPTEVIFTAYDMRDICYGGIGEEIGKFPATVPHEVTFKAISRRATELAIQKRKLELELIENDIIAGYAERILNQALGI